MLPKPTLHKDGLENLTLIVISPRHMSEDMLMSSVVYLMVVKYVSGGSCILMLFGD